VHPAYSWGRLVSCRRLPPFKHPLFAAFVHVVDSLCTALSPGSTRSYNTAVRQFLTYLATHHPEVNRLELLHRDHILGWITAMRVRKPPLATTTCIGRLIALRCVFNELACSTQRFELARLIRREDIPRTPQRLPRPLTAEQDQILQREFCRRNDLGGNVFLLLRHTGMRISECADLSFDCLRSPRPGAWAIQVPLGKLQKERMVPVDAFVRDLVHRLRFFRSLDPMPPDQHLLARTSSKNALVRQLRDYLHQVCHSLGLPTNIVPHQTRHSFATEMLRSGVSFPVLMKLLGHVDPEMTMRYVDIALTDLEREFQLARSHPRHLAPLPKLPSMSTRVGREGIIDALIATQHLMEIFRRSLPMGDARSRLDRLSNRLSKLLAQIKRLPNT
jgi:site-specific recombinase XerD